MQGPSSVGGDDFLSVFSGKKVLKLSQMSPLHGVFILARLVILTTEHDEKE